MTLGEELEFHWNETSVITPESIVERVQSYKENNVPQSVIDKRLEDMIPNVTKQIFFLERGVDKINILTIFATSLEDLKKQVKDLNWVSAPKSVSDSKLIFVQKLLH